MTEAEWEEKIKSKGFVTVAEYREYLSTFPPQAAYQHMDEKSPTLYAPPRPMLCEEKMPGVRPVVIA